MLSISAEDGWRLLFVSATGIHLLRGSSYSARLELQALYSGDGPEKNVTSSTERMEVRRTGQQRQIVERADVITVTCGSREWLEAHAVSAILPHGIAWFKSSEVSFVVCNDNNDIILHFVHLTREIYCTQLNAYV